MSGIFIILELLLVVSLGFSKTVNFEKVQEVSIHSINRKSDATRTAQTPECLNFGPSTSGNIDSFKGFGRRNAQAIVSGGQCSHNLSHWLWHKSKSSRMWALNSTFVTGVKDGTLHPTSFGVYMLQDAVFCLEISKSLEVAANKQRDGPLKAFLEHKVKSYKRCADNLFAKWHIRNASTIVVGPECQGYIDNHVNATRDEDPIYAVVASIPCERLWPWLGQVLNSQDHHFGAYTDWVRDDFDHTDDGYKKLEAFVNDYYSRGKIDKNKALHYYLESMEKEAAFFDSIPS